MSLENQLLEYKKTIQVNPCEEKIQETICKSKEAFFASEQERILSYHEFLWAQLRLIQKKWWILQFLLLAVLWAILSFVQEDIYVQRSMGVTASLFVILIIPEFWKNRACQCMEIEASSYYSLRQIYAARMLLFGMADIFSLTIFCGTVSAGLEVGLEELLIQFLFPLSVTACICFGTLCSKFAFSESAAMGLCTIWSGVWLFIILNDNVYTKIALPVWVLLFGFALIYLLTAVCRTLLSWKNYWEVPWNGIEI